jgi:hypothetical protein
VTVVIDSNRHASCACCAATWIQEGSWQRSIRPARAAIEFAGLSDDVITLPDPTTRSQTAAQILADPVLDDPEAIAT